MVHVSILADEYKQVQKFLTDESVLALLCKRINTSLQTTWHYLPANCLDENESFIRLTLPFR